MINQEIKLEEVLLSYKWGEECLEQIINEIKFLKADKYIIVTDDSVYNLHGNELYESLSSTYPVLVLSSPPGENHKNLETLFRYINSALAWGATRKTVVVTLGGGVPGNIGGLLASLLFRGIRLVHIPTTLIALADSVLSLKQAINGKSAKNLIGAFYVPTIILGDLAYLKTLSLEELKSGLCETVKNTLAIFPQDQEKIREYLPLALDKDSEALRVIFQLSLAAKLHVMAEDKYEKKRALILEYGHTIGHAIELEVAQLGEGRRISHGEAVAIGMLTAAELSSSLKCLDDKGRKSHFELLEPLSIKPHLPPGVSSGALIERMKSDNKRGYINLKEDELGLILLERLGSPKGLMDCPITPVETKQVLSILEQMEA